jgi:hypothetical protein
MCIFCWKMHGLHEEHFRVPEAGWSETPAQKLLVQSFERSWKFYLEPFIRSKVIQLWLKDRQTHGQADTWTDRHTDRQTHRQTHTRTDTHTDRHTHGQTHTRTDTHTDGQTDTWTDRCTDRHMPIHPTQTGEIFYALFWYLSLHYIREW